MFEPDTGLLWASQTSMMLVIVIACLVSMSSLGRLLDVFPAVLRCLFRPKEHENLANSMSLSRSRNFVCAAAFLPVVIITARFGLYPPLLDAQLLGGSGSTPFWGTLTPVGCTLVSLGVWTSYILLRLILKAIAKHITGDVRIRQREWLCVTCIPHNFFILLSVVWIVCVLIMMPLGVDIGHIRNTLLWEIAVIYFICLIHKTHFFVRYRGFFSAFLYLCTLEILPSGLLVLSAIVLQHVY